MFHCVQHDKLHFLDNIYIIALFYVTCTRAKKSLAVVMYTNNPEKVKEEVIKKGWFKEEEIVTI
jgi:gamma-glutamylcyclotransferase (GGCT)/AIG2-like uncharacterized protein YtfP